MQLASLGFPEGASPKRVKFAKSLLDSLWSLLVVVSLYARDTTSHCRRRRVRPADPVQQLLESVYAAPMHPNQWHVVLEQLSSLSGVMKAALITHNVPNSEHRMLAILGDGVRESVPVYEMSYFKHDEWTLRFPQRGFTGRVIEGEEIWPHNLFYRSTFYNEFLRRFDVCQMACIASGRTGNIFEALSIYRGPLDGGFGPEVFATLKILAPHLQTALSMRRMLAKLESRVMDLENALDFVTTGLVLLDAHGKCLLANKTAKALLDQRNGLFLSHGTLSTTSTIESAALHEVISSAISPTHGFDHQRKRATLISRKNARSLQLLTAPLRREHGSGSGRAVALLFISDPEQKAAAPSEILQVLFGLTSAEARLAIALLDGRSLSEAAECHNVSLETVRSQIKSLFQKTGTRRQGELVRLLASVSYPKLEA
jgi:DNA-binding CsgD family transcriptional regulator